MAKKKGGDDAAIVFIARESLRQGFCDSRRGVDTGEMRTGDGRRHRRMTAFAREEDTLTHGLTQYLMHGVRTGLCARIRTKSQRVQFIRKWLAEL